MWSGCGARLHETGKIQGCPVLCALYLSLKNMKLFSNNGKTHYFYIRSLLEFRVRYQHPLCVQNLMVSTDQPFLGLKKV